MSNKNHKPLHLPNRYIPHMIIIGLAIGTANFFLNPNGSIGKVLLIQTITSTIIGYSLLTIIFNQGRISSSTSGTGHWIKLGLAFAAVALVASELELLNRSVLYSEPYQAFSGKGMYIFNAIITVILGFTFNQIGHLKAKQAPKTTVDGPASTSLEKIPVRQGKDTLLLDVNNISYFEASDNFSYLFDIDNQKYLCDSSLRQLELKLPKIFLRVHRSYMINTQQILRISTYGKGRYALYFHNHHIQPVITGKSYAPMVRELTKV